MTVHLEACPFCGSAEVDPNGWLQNNGATGPACDGCGATAESSEAWNKRAGAVPADFLRICAEERVRSSLTSLPLKLRFLRERGLASLEEVHAWMSITRRAFESAVDAHSRVAS